MCCFLLFSINYFIFTLVLGSFCQNFESYFCFQSFQIISKCFYLKFALSFLYEFYFTIFIASGYAPRSIYGQWRKGGIVFLVDLYIYVFKRKRRVFFLGTISLRMMEIPLQIYTLHRLPGIFFIITSKLFNL